MNAVFTDRTGQRWHVPLDVALAERVQTETGIDLLSPAVVPRLLKADPVLIWRVLSTLLASRIESAELSKRLKGETVRTAAAAIVEAITDFFPQRRTHGPAVSASPNLTIRRRWSAATGWPERLASTPSRRALPLAS